MLLTAHGKVIVFGSRMLILILFIGKINHEVQAQPLTLSLKAVPLVTAFREVEKKSDHRFVFTREVLEGSHPVSLQVKNVTIDVLLPLLFEGQPLTYQRDDKFILVRHKIAAEARALPGFDLSGQVHDEAGVALPGVSLRLKGTDRATATDEQGRFRLTGVEAGTTLLVTSIGYAPRELGVNGPEYLEITLVLSVSLLDETVVRAYGSTTRRLNTGNISRVTAEEIAQQPVSDPLATLQGRVAGMVLTQSSGVPGAAFKVRIRGQSSLKQGSDPLYVIDGVPFVLGAGPLNLVSNTAAFGPEGTGGLSPLNLIDPADIESIEVLKDADATAIYGSRGTGGVVLITTKKGKTGSTTVSLRTYAGFSRVTRMMGMLNTQQYLQMRREGFKNDGVTPTPDLAPDLFLWDTTRYTDYKKLLLGGTGHTTDGQLSISGGKGGTSFLLGAGYHREASVFPGDLHNRRGSLSANLGHHSNNGRFTLGWSAYYSVTDAHLIATDLSASLVLPPHVNLYTAEGALNWEEGGIPFRTIGLANPLGYLFQTYTGRFDHLLSNLQLSYTLWPGLRLKTSLGYNSALGDETQLNPSTSLDPSSGDLPYAYFATKVTHGWIMEPQLTWEWHRDRHRLDLLAGWTGQEITARSNEVFAANFTNDLQLQNIASAGFVYPTNASSQYRYTALFGRMGYSYAAKYLLNLSGRRDGSSRFGPERRFHNFGALGVVWVLSEEKGIKKALSFLSFAKLRGSYGRTGNDQIGNDKFRDSWVSTYPGYNNAPGLVPSSLFNPGYAWEETRKLEAALETGFWEDRFLLSLSWYQARSGNQLLNYTLPIQTGFTSVLKNIGAELQNRGWEFSLSSTLALTKDLLWKTGLNFTAPKNKLLSFPGLAQSSYALTYREGSPVTVARVYHSLGVAPATGILELDDKNKDGRITTADYEFKDVDPVWYGGWSNSLSFKGLTLDFLFEFKKGKGFNYLYNLGYNVPGYGFANQPLAVLRRWQKQGDRTTVQRFTASSDSAPFKMATQYLVSSDAVYSDASYVRLKTLHLSYTLPSSWLKGWKESGGSVFLEGQNLLTLTHYQGGDPETRNLYTLPPLRTLAAGFSFHF